MKTFITSIKTIRSIMNVLILVTLIAGASVIIRKSHDLLFHPEEIDVLRLDMPWLRPVTDVTLALDKTVLEKNPELFDRVQKNIVMHDILERTVFVILMVLILLQVKLLFTAIKKDTFFVPENRHIIKSLSMLVGLWVLWSLLIYEMIPWFIPVELIQFSINFTPLNESVFHNLISAIDFKMLFVALILYVITVLFREGHQLKEDSELTI